MEQLFNLEEIIGLTIEKSIFIPDDNKLVLKFNENKFIVFLIFSLLFVYPKQQGENKGEKK